MRNQDPRLGVIDPRREPSVIVEARGTGHNDLVDDARRKAAAYFDVEPAEVVLGPVQAEAVQTLEDASGHSEVVRWGATVYVTLVPGA